MWKKTFFLPLQKQVKGRCSDFLKKKKIWKIKNSPEFYLYIFLCHRCLTHLFTTSQVCREVKNRPKDCFTELMQRFHWKFTEPVIFFLCLLLSDFLDGVLCSLQLTENNFVFCWNNTSISLDFNFTVIFLWTKLQGCFAKHWEEDHVDFLCLRRVPARFVSFRSCLLL